MPNQHEKRRPDAEYGDILSNTDVIIVGTGFSGLGLGAQLARRADTSFVILERADDVGGTWRENTYPGAACDIQSHLYSYSFRPNPDWSRVYATQPEILAYLQKTAVDEGLIPHIYFQSEVLNAKWDELTHRWVVRTSRGTHVARAFVTASGHLSDPKTPNIPGIDEFAGDLFHSATWNHEVVLQGKRIGVIGTGASAIQIIPEVVEQAQQVTVFQRSAPYVIPRRDYFYSDAEKGMFRKIPATAQAMRDELFWANESRFPQRRKVPTFLADIKATALGHLRNQVEDPHLLEQLTPDYEIGCKRILISNDYYPALTRPNVTLDTSGIARVTPSGVVTGDGEHELDIIVVCTGFEASDLPIAYRVFGRDELPLSERWADGAGAYACTAVNGFPNLFVMLGPNTGLGAGSIIYMVETQIAYIADALSFIASQSVTIEIPLDAEAEYVRSIEDRSEGTVWMSGGCASWYVDPRSGRLTTLWPDFMTQFRDENGTFSPAPYLVQQRKAQPAEV
ncbi:NAD(P)/FAD-dependent oxidoreductase [Mycolicibacterium sp. YH-1]|uniref:flavin-containing monooxygenase n=1 Tax=Mycolicibacterium sp. YH-1 TaxID=2908837 RepID=UPI001F4C42D6|nr:NAD(P)/FAD-dependent oxidoreductase [Mycolicibacterium sp. YH-1]UNB53141.1 NAD(P)/FAD-dependent oxidoreductase [Mycolicibacterium sp. YH-1]